MNIGTWHRAQLRAVFRREHSKRVFSGLALCLLTHLSCVGSVYEENQRLRSENLTLKAQLKERETITPSNTKDEIQPLERVYVVKNRDALSSIAQEMYGDPTMWEEIYQANRDVLGGSPHRLQVGMKLKIPALSEVQSEE